MENVQPRDAGENAAAPITLAAEDVANLNVYVARAHDWNSSSAERAAACEELAAYLAACLRRYPHCPAPH